MTDTPNIRLTPIGYVHSSRRDLEDDNWMVNGVDAPLLARA